MIFITVIMKASVRYFSRKGIDRHRLHESVPVHRTRSGCTGFVLLPCALLQSADGWLH